MFAPLKGLKPLRIDSRVSQECVLSVRRCVVRYLDRGLLSYSLIYRARARVYHTFSSLSIGQLFGRRVVVFGASLRVLGVLRLGVLSRGHALNYASILFHKYVFTVSLLFLGQKNSA